MRALFRLIALLSLTALAFAQADRDFAGRWYFKPEKSELQALPAPPESIIRIEQHATLIHEFRVTGSSNSEEEIRSYSTDGHETKRTEGDIRISSQTKWEGAALLINTIVSAPRDSYTVADRWRLSKDGSRLTIVRHIIRAQSDTESTIVYEKTQKALTPPKLITNETAPAAVAPPPPNNVAPPPNNARPPLNNAPEETVLQPAPAPEQADFLVARGTKLPLRLINSVDTKHSAPGDRVYLQTVYPILSHGHVVIPPGSYVMGSLTEVQQAGRVKGKSVFFLRFDSLTLPNGTTRDFRARMSDMDADGRGSLDRKEGTVQGESGKGADARTIGMGTAIGAGAGAAIGSAAGHLGAGAGIGALAGAAAGLASVLATRGPDAVLPRGSTVEMVLDRDLTFTRAEVSQR